MKLKGLLDRTKQLRNDNCGPMESFGVEDNDPDGHLRTEVLRALADAGINGAAAERHVEHVCRAAKNLRHSLLAVHYQCDGLAAELDMVNHTLKRRGAEPIF